VGESAGEQKAVGRRRGAKGGKRGREKRTWPSASQEEEKASERRRDLFRGGGRSLGATRPGSGPARGLTKKKKKKKEARPP